MRLGYCTKHNSPTVCKDCEIDALRAEVERLEKDNNAIKEELFTDHLKKSITNQQKLATHNFALREQVKDLQSQLSLYREALEAVMDKNKSIPFSPAYRIAKSALEGGE